MKNTTKKIVLTLGVMSTLSMFLGLNSLVDTSKSNADNDFQIKIDTLGYDLAGLPKGVKGKTYPIFNSSVVGMDGEVVSEAKVLVFYDANGDTYQGKVSDDDIVTFENNRFDTQKAGIYVIEYTAEMYDTNKILRVFVEVLENYQPIEYTINEQIVSNAFTGEKVYLPEGAMEYDKQFGVPNLQVKVYRDYGTQTQKEITYYDFGRPYFLPRVSGAYTVEYSVTNILGEAEKTVETKTIVISDKGQPIIDEPSFSSVAHVGKEIVFPDVEAIEYVDGKIYYLPTTVYVNGEICENKTFTPTESGEVEVYYTATGKVGGQVSQTSTQIISVQNLKDKVQTAVVKEGKLFIDNYFKNENFITAYENNKLRFNVSNGNARATFRNAIPVEKLQMGFLANCEGSIFDNLKIKIQDTANAKESVEFTLKVNNEISDSIDVYVNGSKYCSLSNKSFSNRANGEIALKFENGAFTLTDATISPINVNGYVDGTQFAGFSSGKVFISFELNGVQSNSYFELLTLADDVVKFMSRDTTYPVFINAKDFEAKNGEKGDVITFKKPASFDLLDSNLRVYIEIIGPDESYFANFDEDEIIDEYVFTATLSGTYYIRYMATDSQGNDCVIEANSLFIADRQSPLVIEKPNLPKTVSINERFTFTNVKFEDNVTTNCKTYIYVIFGDYEKHFVVDNTYVFRKEGEYRVVYGAIDKAGNKTEVMYYVTCK